MLIYCAQLDCQGADAPNAVLRCVSAWLNMKTRKQVPLHLFTAGRDTAIGSLRVQAWRVEDPLLYAVRVTHPDSRVKGRQWTTEIGISRESPTSSTVCSILVSTSEISPMVSEIPSVTRPILVDFLARRGVLSPSTPGLRLRTVDNARLEGVFHELHDRARRHAIILVAPDTTGEYLVHGERLQSLTIGLADVILIEQEVPHAALAAALGEAYAPYRGALLIVFPVSDRSISSDPAYRRILGRELEELQRAGAGPEQAVLNILAHRSNLPLSWRHVSPDTVRSAATRNELQRRQHQISTKGQLQEYVDLLERVNEEEGAIIKQLKHDVEQQTMETLLAVEDARVANDELRQMRYELDGMKAALVASGGSQVPAGTAGLTSVQRDAVISMTGEHPELHDALQVAVLLHPGAVIVLPSAWKSAEGAHAFRHVAKAFDLLCRLFGDYRDALANGTPDSEARKLFGSSWSAKESETVEKNKTARRLRTFTYNGNDVEMMTHLKIGVKDSATETFRAHFKWDASAGVIVLGHCGAHLDHD